MDGEDGSTTFLRHDGRSQILDVGGQLVADGPFGFQLGTQPISLSRQSVTLSQEPLKVTDEGGSVNLVSPIQLAP